MLKKLQLCAIIVLLSASLACNLLTPQGALKLTPAANSKSTPEATLTAPVLVASGDLTNTPGPAQTLTFTTAPLSTLSPTATQVVISPSPVPTLSAAAAKTALLDAFKQLANAFPFRINETDKDIAQTITLTTDYAAADRYHSIGGPDTDPNQNETITIGTKTWWKIKGQWDPTPSGTLPQNNFWKWMGEASDVAYASQDTIAGTPCYVLAFKLDVHAPGLYLSGSGQVRVGITDGLPHEFDFTPGPNITGGPTHQVYTYGITVDIQQPVP